jgi:hypothetical protein
VSGKSGVPWQRIPDPFAGASGFYAVGCEVLERRGVSRLRPSGQGYDLKLTFTLNQHLQRQRQRAGGLCKLVSIPKRLAGDAVNAILHAQTRLVRRRVTHDTDYGDRPEFA